MSPARLDAIEELDALASSPEGRKSVAALIYDVADVRKEWGRDVDLPTEQRVTARREQAELEEYGFGFASMDFVTLDSDAHNAAMDPANDFLESHSPTSSALNNSESVDQSIQRNVFYAKYTAELASSAIANQAVSA